MEDSFNENDPVAGLLAIDPDLGELRLDANDYEKYYPTEIEAQRLGEQYSNLIAETLEDHKPFFEKIKRNIAAYRGLPTDAAVDGQRPVLTLPIVGRIVDQTVAWEVTTAMRPDPVVSVDPHFPAQYQTLTQIDAPSGGMMPVELPVDGEDVARTLELYLNYKLKDRLQFRRFLKNAFKDIHIAGQAVAKVVYERTERSAYAPRTKKAPEGWVEVVGRDEILVESEEPCKLLNISPFNFMMPMDETDPQTARALFERIPTSSTILREKLSGGKEREYDLVPEEDFDKLLGMTTEDWMAEADKAVREQVDGRSQKKPRSLHDIYEVPFFYQVKVVEADPETGKKKKRFVTLSMMGHFHTTYRKFLAIWRNPYNHGKRPYAVCFEDEEANRFASVSLVEKIAKHQSLVSQMTHLQIQSQVQANNFDIWVESEDNPIVDQLKTPRYAGRALVGGKFGEDFGYASNSRNGPGLSNDISFIIDDLHKTGGMDPWRQGMSMGANRTPAATVSQIMEAGYLKPLMTLQAVSDFVGELVRLLVETAKQYKPFGETLPVQDPETKKLIDIPMMYPKEAVLNNFRIQLTAAEEALAFEAEFDRQVMLNNLMAQISQEFAQIAGATADPNASPALTQLFVDLFKARIEGAKSLLESAGRRDTNRLLPNAQRIDALVMEKQMAMQMMQQQQMQQQGGAGGPESVQGAQGAMGPGGAGDLGLGMAGASGGPALQGTPQGSPEAGNALPPGLSI